MFFTLKYPRFGLNFLDGLLVVFAAWCLVPPLVFGHDLRWTLPFDQHLSAGLTARNLLAYWGILILRLHLRSRDESPSWGAYLLQRASTPTLGVALFALLFLVYLNAAQPRRWPAGDTIPGKFIPISLLTEGDLDLSEYSAGVPHARRYGFWEVGGKVYSAYPVAPSLTVLPVYALLSWAFPGALDSVREVYATPGADDTENLANLLEQVSAAAVTALAVVLTWLLARSLGTDHRLACMFALALAFGTSLMSTAALALWQHGPACLALAVMLQALAKASRAEAGRTPCANTTSPAHRGPGRSATPLIVAGLAAGWAYACRPSLLVVPPLVALWVLSRFRWRVLYFAVPCAVVGLSVLASNYIVFGRITGGYARNLSIFASWDGMAVVTMLFSPSRGLFFFSPFLLFALPGMARAVRRPFTIEGLSAYLALATLALFSFWSTWAAGSSFGSRYLCEATLLLVIVLAADHRFPVRRRWAMELFLLAVLFSCHLHVVGARDGDAGWTENVFKPDDIAAAWSWGDSQAAYTLFRGRP